ncbi:unnamed protein product [Symbiodinium sp. CCMP2592]|nr:unnamed protein product [Symbiodinium sp. CCMP2592]
MSVGARVMPECSIILTDFFEIYGGGRLQGPPIQKEYLQGAVAAVPFGRLLDVLPGICPAQPKKTGSASAVPLCLCGYLILRLQRTRPYWHKTGSCIWKARYMALILSQSRGMPSSENKQQSAVASSAQMH